MTDRDAMDEALVGRFLEAYPEERYSAYELGQNLDGISASDVSRWRRGKWTWLSRKKRRAIQSALGLDELDVSELKSELDVEAS